MKNIGNPENKKIEKTSRSGRPFALKGEIVIMEKK